MKIRPLHDRVIVKRLEEERKTASGIVIPDTAAEKPDQGEVMAVGKGKVMDDQGPRPGSQSRRPHPVRQVLGPDREGRRRGTARDARRRHHGRRRVQVTAHPIHHAPDSHRQFALRRPDDSGAKNSGDSAWQLKKYVFTRAPVRASSRA